MNSITHGFSHYIRCFILTKAVEVDPNTSALDRTT